MSGLWIGVKELKDSTGGLDDRITVERLLEIELKGVSRSKLLERKQRYETEVEILEKRVNAWIFGSLMAGLVSIATNANNPALPEFLKTYFNQTHTSLRLFSFAALIGLLIGSFILQQTIGQFRRLIFVFDRAAKRERVPMAQLALKHSSPYRSIPNSKYKISFPDGVSRKPFK